MASVKQNILNGLRWFKKNLNKELYGDFDKSVADLPTNDKSSITGAINEIHNDLDDSFEYGLYKDNVIVKKNAKAHNIYPIDDGSFHYIGNDENRWNSVYVRSNVSVVGSENPNMIVGHNPFIAGEAGSAVVANGIASRVLSGATIDPYFRLYRELDASHNTAQFDITVNDSGSVKFITGSHGEGRFIFGRSDASGVTIQPSVDNNSNLGNSEKRFYTGWFGRHIKIGGSTTQGTNTGDLTNGTSIDSTYGIITRKVDGSNSRVAIFNGTNDTKRFILECKSNGETIVNMTDGSYAYPSVTNNHYWGGPNYRWKTIYAVNALSTSSDKKLKDHIEYLEDDEHLYDFFIGLKPVMYTLKDGDNNRRHMGLYAQDVAEVAKDTIGDLSVYEAAGTKNQDTAAGDYYSENIPEENLNWSLKYEELIAPTIAILQKSLKRIEILEQEIEELKK